MNWLYFLLTFVAGGIVALVIADARWPRQRRIPEEMNFDDGVHVDFTYFRTSVLARASKDAQAAEAWAGDPLTAAAEAAATLRKKLAAG